MLLFHIFSIFRLGIKSFVHFIVLIIRKSPPPYRPAMTACEDTALRFAWHQYRDRYVLPARPSFPLLRQPHRAKYCGSSHTGTNPFCHKGRKNRTPPGSASSDRYRSWEDAHRFARVLQGILLTDKPAFYAGAQSVLRRRHHLRA